MEREGTATGQRSAAASAGWGRTSCPCWSSSKDEEGESESLSSDAEQQLGYGSTPEYSLLQLSARSESHWSSDFMHRLRRLQSSLGTAGTAAMNRSRRLRKHASFFAIVESTWYEPALVTVAIANALLVGIQIDNPHVISAHCGHMLAFAFNLVYTFEIVSKLSVYGYKTVFKQSYNWFTLAVTIAAWVELFLHIVTEICEERRVYRDAFSNRWREYASTDLVSILQLGRVVRLGVINPELGRLLGGFAGALEKIAWVTALALLWFFMSACCATVFVGHAQFETKDLNEVKDHFDGILHSMFTLLEIGLIEGWPSYVRPFIHSSHAIYVPFFLAFICVANFFFLNVFTAVVVETVLAAHNEEDNDEKDQSENKFLLTCMRLYRKLQSLCEEEAKEKDWLELTNLRRWLKSDQELQYMIKDLGRSTDYFFSIARCCDHDKSGRVPLKALIEVIEDSRAELKMSNFVKFMQHQASRVDYLDGLMHEIIRVLPQISNKSQA